MQQLQLKTEDEPQDPVISTEVLLDPDQLNEMFGEGFTELKDLFLILFKTFSLELEEETRSLNMTLDEDEKKLILNLKKKTKSKSLAKKGQVYAFKKELKTVSLSLVYELDYGTSNDLQPIEPMTDLVKPLDLTRSKTVMSDSRKLPIEPVSMDNPDLTTLLPHPEYAEELTQELPILYEEKFNPVTTDDTRSGVDTGSTDYRIGPEKLIRAEDLFQRYEQDLIFQTPTQKFEGRSGGIIHNVYKNPIEKDGELFHEEYILTSKRLTTAYQALLDSGLSISSRYSSRFGGEYIVAVNGSGERDGTYWEIKVNGRYIPVTADKYLVPPGAEITLVRKTARRIVCGQPVAG